MKLASEGDNAAAVALKLGEDPPISVHYSDRYHIHRSAERYCRRAILAGRSLSGAIVRSAKRLGRYRCNRRCGHCGDLYLYRCRQTGAETSGTNHAGADCWTGRPPDAIAGGADAPFVVLLTVYTHFAATDGVKQNSQSSVTEEEIHAMLEEGSEAGVIEQHQQNGAECFPAG
jgi:putative hemolysin